MKKTTLTILTVLLTAVYAFAQKDITIKLDSAQRASIRSIILDEYEDHRADTQDWANFRFYAKKNALVTTKPKAVLMGNSITQFWAEFDGEWLTAHNILGRGISGQVSGQMLMRFRQDVIDLKPEYVVILCGINDIGRNQGYITVDHVMQNIVSMVELARYNKVKPVLCTLCPAKDIGWRPQVKDTPQQVKRLNTMIQDYCKKEGITCIDYFSAMVDNDGVSLIQDYARDSVHPNLKGYKVMEDLLCKALKIKN